MHLLTNLIVFFVFADLSCAKVSCEEFSGTGLLVRLISSTEMNSMKTELVFDSFIMVDRRIDNYIILRNSKLSPESVEYALNDPVDTLIKSNTDGVFYSQLMTTFCNSDVVPKVSIPDLNIHLMDSISYNGRLMFIQQDLVSIKGLIADIENTATNRLYINSNMVIDSSRQNITVILANEISVH